MFEESVDVIIFTLWIQMRQSTKKSILLISVHALIDTVSSVEYGKHTKKWNYSISNNQYERYLNILCYIAWKGKSKAN